MTCIPTWLYLILCVLVGFGAGQIAFYVRQWVRK